MTRTSYRLFEQAKRQPNMGQLMDIADALGVAPSYITAEAERRAHERLAEWSSRKATGDH